MPGPLLEIAGARVERDGRAILDVESFVIREGEHLAILGPNGAGKSTLIGLLTRDILPLWTDPPAVRFRGEERAELAQIRSLLGVVSAAWQDVVDVHLTAFEVALGGRFGSLGVPPHLRASVTDEDRSAAAAALEAVAMSAFADRDMTTLSTGEARRVLVARALVHDPSVIVLDEPCAGLDPTAAYHVRQMMRELAESGRTLVLVTHHIEDVVSDIDRVVMLRGGSIYADGPKAELLTSERLTGLFGVPLEVVERNGEYRIW